MSAFDEMKAIANEDGSWDLDRSRRFLGAMFGSIKERGFLGTASSAAQQSSMDVNQWNMDKWNEYKDWATEMSNTAIQRGAADLKAAGFNPALAVTGGLSASGAIGSSPTFDTSAYQANLSANTSLLNTALRIIGQLGNTAIKQGMGAIASAASS